MIKTKTRATPRPIRFMDLTADEAAADLGGKVERLERARTKQHAEDACQASRIAWLVVLNLMLLTGLSLKPQRRRLEQLMRRCQAGVQGAAMRVTGRDFLLLIHYSDAIKFRLDALAELTRSGLKATMQAMGDEAFRRLVDEGGK